MLSRARAKVCSAWPDSQPQMMTSVPLTVLAAGSARHSWPPVLVVMPETSGVTVLVGACSSGAPADAETTIDANSLAVTRRYYDPYGNPLGTQPGTWISPDENHGLLGQPTDPGTGLDLLGARDYDPSEGRFLSPDPVFEAGDPNQMGGYTYAT